MANKIVSVVIILAVILLGYFLLNNKVETDNLSEMESYLSEKLGLEFEYPKTYFIQEIEESTEERFRTTLVLAEDTEENRRVFAGEEPGREGPPTITIGIFQNNLDNYQTENWIKNTSFSNHGLSDGRLDEVFIGGERAIGYSATGLYENKNVVIARDNFIYMFTVFYLSPEDQIIKDFEDLLKTVKFNESSLERFKVRELSDLIILDSPLEGEKIKSPLVIKGKARGTWFFEATFPVTLTNWDGLIIKEHFAEATSDWMTAEFVPFEATIEFEKPDFGERGSLILHKSNPSGLWEHDNALEISIFFE
jgi:hypothetical protein